MTSSRRRGPSRRRSNSPQRVVAMQPVPTGRLLAVYGLLCAGLVGLAGRLAWLQVVDATNLQNRAHAIQTQTTKPIG